MRLWTRIKRALGLAPKPDAGLSVRDAMEEHLRLIKKEYLIVIVDGEPIAFRRGDRRPWDGYRSIKMMEAENPARVGYRPAGPRGVSDEHHPDIQGVG